MSFDGSLALGDWGEETVKRLLLTKYPEVRTVPKDIEVQMEWADLVIPKQYTDDGQHLKVEVKAEERFTGNLFWETWSNYPHREGWGITTPASQLFYLFRDNGHIYHVKPVSDLQWLIGRFGHELREVSQCKNEQHNHTKGLLVPIDDFSIIRRLK